MAEVYKRSGSPFWYYDYTLPSGERKRGPTKRKLKAEAKAVAEAMQKSALDRIQLGVRDELTLAEATQRYLASTVRDADHKNLESRIKKLLGGVEGKAGLDPKMMLHDLTTPVIEALRVTRLREGSALNTINNEVKVLSRAYNLARHDWNIRVAPDVKFNKYAVAGKLRWLTPDEEARLLEELRPDRRIQIRNGKGKGSSYEIKDGRARRQMQDNYDLAVVLLDTGARYSEIGTLTWAAVDTLKLQWLEIFRGKVKENVLNRDGILHMTARVQEVFKRRRAEDPIGVYVFPGYGGSDDDVEAPRGKATKALRAAIARAGLNAPHLVARYGRATVHTFRDTFASRLIQNGASLYEVQRLLGHADPRMTQKYAKLVPDQTASKAAAILNGLRKGDEFDGTSDGTGAASGGRDRGDGDPASNQESTQSQKTRAA